MSLSLSSNIHSVLRLLCTTIFSACRYWWWWPSSKTPNDESPPKYSCPRYGFQQTATGTLIPRHFRSSILLTKSLPIFSILGTEQDILHCLLLRSSEDHTSTTAVFCNISPPPYSFASDVLVQLYRIPTSGVPWWRCSAWFSANRMLVIRPARLAECPRRRSSSGRRQKLLASVRAPQGVTLVEIAGILTDVGFRGHLDLTRNKALNISVIGRARSTSISSLAQSFDNDPAVCLLPPYKQCSEDHPPPPPYSP